LHKSGEQILFTAGDIVNFLSCPHHTALDLADLQAPLPKTEANEELRLIQAKGALHESQHAKQLRKQHHEFVDIRDAGDGARERIRATRQAMQAGADILYQPVLRDGCLTGTADFFRRIERPSALGAWSYEVLDTKLAMSARTRFVIQLAFYSKILAAVQGLLPARMHVVLGDGREKAYAFKDYNWYLERLLQRFFEQVQSELEGCAKETSPEPRDHCEVCRWMEICEKQRQKADHLWQVANIRKSQIRKLQGAGIHTMEALAKMDPDMHIPGMAEGTLDTIQRQARLQVLAREQNENMLEHLPLVPGQKRGFERLPRPSEGDMFFDMEGNPLEEGGLEYLFGLCFLDHGKPVFKAFWAHSRSEEKTAFEGFIDFVTRRLRAYPDAHIYHYAHYEQTALKRLMSLHGTREAEVDNLLRAGRLVDLYKVVREGLRVSEPSYSIKNLEHFYMEKRSGDVQSAGASIVYYERWKETGDTRLLEKIRAYNEDDVVSTCRLRQWLLELRPEGIAWAGDDPDKQVPVADPGALNAHEQRIEAYRQLLLGDLPQDRSDWGEESHLRELAWQLLDFHRREDKPQWWAMFARMEMDARELAEDIECIAGLELDPAIPPFPVKKSICYTFTFPEQETKLKTGDKAARLDTGKALSSLVIDEQARRVSFTLSQKADPPPECLHIGPGGPIYNDLLREAVFRFADTLVNGNQRYRAVESMLRREMPRIRNHKPKKPVVDEKKDIVPQVTRAVAGLNESCLFVQGPPGSGKTYTGSRVIVELLKQGFRVGVSSNSHKAISNLLHAVEDAAMKAGVRFAGVKKSNRGNDGTLLNGRMIRDVFDNMSAAHPGNQLVAGTAWLFSRPEMDRQLDFLFVDEAGQVSLANLAAMGVSAKNLVLLGDQMQLGQPIQGIHPGRSGESSLEYLLNGLATIPPEQGVFLKTTWRMHPDVCRLISEMIYDGRLEPEPNNSRQELILKHGAHPYLLPAGVRFVPAVHDGCARKSQEEAAVVREMVESLVCQQYRDRAGKVHDFGLDNILVVAPYNMQVNLLKQILPEGARVGTVDRFQGQQAEVVIVSMATSGEACLPRNIDFLYSKNRLNVALSRARSLAVLVASPELMSINCSRPQEAALVNALCRFWAGDIQP